MDIIAVWTATDKDLQELGLVELGHRICLRNYCKKEMQGEINDEKETLISVIKKKKLTDVTKGKVRNEILKRSILDGFILTLIEINMCQLEPTTEVEPENLSLKIQQIKTKF